MVTSLVTQQPGCGYPAVQWVFGHEVKIAFNLRLWLPNAKVQPRA